MRDCFQSDQTCRAATQNSLSNSLSLGLQCRRLNTTSLSQRKIFKNETTTGGKERSDGAEDEP